MTPIDYNNPNEMWRHNGYDPYKGMSDDERMKAGCMQVVAFIMMLIVGLAICALFGSCTTTKYVEVVKVRTDTTYITQHQRDSIWMHDSILVREKGDTFYMERWHTKYVVNEKHDTTYVATHDTIPQPYPVTEYVEKPLSKIEKGLMGVGILTLMALVIFVAMKIKRFLP
jgi:hypothetical protein